MCDWVSYSWCESPHLAYVSVSKKVCSVDGLGFMSSNLSCVFDVDEVREMELIGV